MYRITAAVQQYAMYYKFYGKMQAPSSLISFFACKVEKHFYWM